MGKLIKYEFRKSWVIKAIILVLTAIFELMFLAGTFFENEDLLGFGISFLALTTICAMFIIGVYGIFGLHKDLTTKQSYMLFMTPNSSYKILGAKLIENAGSIIITGALYKVLAIIDITILAAESGQIKDAIALINAILGEHYSIDTYRFVMISSAMISAWIFTVVAGYLAVTLSASILSGKKFSGIISFIFFLIINGAVKKIHNCIMEIYSADLIGFSTGRMIYGLIYYLGLSFAIYVIAAWIMENKLSV